MEVPLPLIQLRGDFPKSTQLDLLSLGYVTAGGIRGEFYRHASEMTRERVVVLPGAEQ